MDRFFLINAAYILIVATLWSCSHLDDTTDKLADKERLISAVDSCIITLDFCGRRNSFARHYSSLLKELRGGLSGIPVLKAIDVDANIGNPDTVMSGNQISFGQWTSTTSAGLANTALQRMHNTSAFNFDVSYGAPYHSSEQEQTGLTFASPDMSYPSGFYPYNIGDINESDEMNGD